MWHTADWLGRRRLYSPDRVALIVEPGGQQYTYRELDDRANRTARFLGARGVGPGDRVAVLAQNCVEHLDLLWACAKLGAVFVPYNWRLAAAELAPLVADAGPAVLCYGPQYAEVAAAIRGEPGAPATVALDPAGALPEDPTLAAELAGLDPAPYPAAPVPPDHPWIILYTGGTTGRSKGAVCTHGSVAANAFNTVFGWQMRPDDVVPIFTPFFHAGGLHVFTTPLFMLGATLVLVTGATFDPGQAIDVVERHGVTVLFLVPTMFQMVMQHPRFATATFPTVRFFISGGAPCPQPVLAAYWAKGKVMKQGYGLTEAGPNNFAMPDEHSRGRPASVGFPILNVQVRLVDDAGQDVPNGEVGEVWLAGPHLFAGYWQNAEATAAALRDGWLRTGDLGYRDREGFYFIVDRKKDMYKSGGENVFPVEVEAVLYQHPAVAECAVVGVPDPKWGEVGLAVVAVKPGVAANAVTAAELIAHCRARLAGYKVPRAVEFRDVLPKSAAGKILKRELR